MRSSADESSQGRSDSSVSTDDVHDAPPVSRLRNTARAIAFYGSLFVVIGAATTYADVRSPFELLFVSLLFLLSAVRIVEGMLSGGPVFADRTLIAPLLALLAFGIIQIVPLSAVGFGSPSSNRLYLSLNPYDTADFILLLGGLVLFGDTLLHLTKTTQRLKAVTATVIVVGVASALFGIFQQLFLADSDQPLSAMAAAPAPYAQFINRNHFALLMEMTLGLVLGLAIKARLSLFAKTTLWILVGFCWIIIISANSRGGIISAAGMILLAVFVHFLTGIGRVSGQVRQRRRLTYNLRLIVITGLMSGLLFGLLAFSIAFIGGDTVVSRFETTGREFNPAADGGAARAEIWQATTRVIVEYPIAGVGFGGFPQAVTKFDTYSNGTQRVLQAHNEYLEIAASGGAIGTILAAVFLGILTRRAHRSFGSRDELGRAICFGAVTGIIGVLLHSVVDFGLHVFINALVFVLLIVLATAGVREVERT